jgi:hypothetical protein
VARAVAGDGAAEALSTPTALKQVGVTMMATLRSLAAVVATVLTRLDEAGGGLRCALRVVRCLLCVGGCEAAHLVAAHLYAHVTLRDTTAESTHPASRALARPLLTIRNGALPTAVGDAGDASASTSLCTTHPRRCCGLAGRRRTRAYPRARAARPNPAAVLCAVVVAGLRRGWACWRRRC